MIRRSGMLLALSAVCCAGPTIWLGGGDPSSSAGSSSVAVAGFSGAGVAGSSGAGVAGSSGAGIAGSSGAGTAGSGAAGSAGTAGANTAGASGVAGADAGGDAAPNPCAPVAIATGAKSPTSLAVDTDGVFWSEIGHAGGASDPNVIMHGALDGSAQAPLLPVSGVPGALALDSAFVYYIQGNTPAPSGYTVFRTAKPGKPPSTRGDYAIFDSPAAAPGQIAVNGNNLVWVDAQQLNLTTLDALPSTESAPASSLSGGFGLALDGTIAWVSEQTGAVFSLDLSTAGPAAPLPGSSPSFGVAVDANNVYWTSQSAVLMRAKTAGAVTPLASCASTCDAVASDGNKVFWATTHEVWEAVPGGTPIRLGSGYSDVHHLAIDATHVYWTDTAGGALWSACK